MCLNLHLVIDSKRRLLLEKISNFVNKNSFCLWWWTAVAIYYWHRYSYDFDFFKKWDLEEEILINYFWKIEGKLVYKSRNTLYFEINWIKVSFFWIEFDVFENCYDCLKYKLFSKENLVLMKLVAILQRAEFKDYVDLYYLFKNEWFKLKDLLDKIEKKYKITVNKKLFLEALVYVDDLEENVKFVGDKAITKNEIKNFFEKIVNLYYKTYKND